MSGIGSGGSLESDNSSGDTIFDGKSLIELVIRQAKTSAVTRQTWRVGTASGILTGKLGRYAVGGTGEISVIMEIPGATPADNWSVALIPLAQITFLEHLP